MRFRGFNFVTRRLWILAAVVAAGAGLSASANAAVLQGISATGAPAGGAVQGLAIGFQFTVTQPEGITVTSLGYYNGWNPDTGLAHPRQVALFGLSDFNADAGTTSTMVASATVDAGTADPLSGGYRFKTLDSSVYLAPGKYGVLAYNMGNGDAYGDGVGVTYGDGIAPERDLYQTISYPSYYNGPSSDAVHASASFQYVVGVPEPASLGLLAAGGGALLMRRRKNAQRKDA